MKLTNLVLLAAIFSVGAYAAKPKAAFTPAADLQWTNAGAPGVSTAPAEGNMAKGASHFFLKYDGGFASPNHHHTPDHFGTLITGTLVLTSEGAEHRLTPGSFFSFTGKAKHVAKCEGTEACVMFIDSRGKWDVVAEKTGR
jgi:quercetin dioxygenase-like cupin family protein